jgi:hypothetical protein
MILGSTQPQAENWYQEYLLEGKGGRGDALITLQLSYANYKGILTVSDSWFLKGLCRPLQCLRYLIE